MNKIDINSDNFGKKRISFDSAQIISLHEDLPDMPRVETNQQPKTEIEKEPTVVSLSKEQEVQNDSSSLTLVGETSNADHNVKNPLQVASNGSSSQTGVANGSIATLKQNTVPDRTINTDRTIGQSANGPDVTSSVDQDGADNTKFFFAKNADSEVNSNTGRPEESLYDSIGQEGNGKDSDDEQNLISAKNITVSNAGDSLPENDKNFPVTFEAENTKSKDKKASTWGKKIAVASIAVVAVIVLISLCYSLWHLFNINK